MEIYLGLPAYNEESSIDPLFTRIEKLHKTLPCKLHVMVYDDGCIDQTKQNVMAWADRLEIVYLDGVVNKGLGAGMNALLKHFVQISDEDDLLVVMDCDDTHDPQQILLMCEMLGKHSAAELVIASRYRVGATVTGVPFHRVLLSIGAAMLYKSVHPIWHVRDYTCGYRAYRQIAIKRALSMYGDELAKERGFACMVEILLKICRAGAHVREIPLQLAYDNKTSASKMDVSGNALRLLKKLIAWRLEGLK